LNNQVIILGVPIDPLTMNQTLDRIEKFIKIGRETGKGHQVATVNVDFITNALSDPELLTLLQGADLAMPDGMPVVWSGRLLGVDFQERVAGVDMILGLAERAAKEKYSIYLLGAAPGVANRTAEILQDRYPELKIAGVCSPFVRSIAETDPGLLDDIRAAQPDILLVAFGNPKQEKWIGHFIHQLNVPVMIGVGGTFDLISGIKKRAPGWMQRSGLEWSFRLAQEPGRLWRRYVRNIGIFSMHFLRQWWLMRAKRRGECQIPVDNFCLNQNTAVISLQHDLSIENVHLFTYIARQALEFTPYILIDLLIVSFLDSSAFGAIVELTRKARSLGGQLSLVNVPKKVQEEIRILRLDQYLSTYTDFPTGLMAYQTLIQENEQLNRAAIFQLQVQTR